MPLKAVLFDVDGVLMDSGDAVARTFVDCFRHHGVPLSKAQEKKILNSMGLTALDWCKALLPKEKHGLAEAMVRWMDRHYAARYVAKHARVSKHLKRVLGRLKRSGLKLGVVTNENKFMASQVLKVLALRKYFDVVVALEDAGSPKPSSAGINLALKKLRVKPGEVVFVGDTIIDLKAGKAAGVAVVLLKNPGEVRHLPGLFGL